MSVCFDPGLVVNCELSMAELSWLLTADLSFEKRVRCLLCKGSSPLGGGGGGSSMLARKLELNHIVYHSGSGFFVQIFLCAQPYAY